MEQFFSFSGDDYKILDESGQVAVQVAGKALSVRDMMVFLDAAGNKIAMLQKKLLSVRQTYQLCTCGHWSR